MGANLSDVSNSGSGIRSGGSHNNESSDDYLHPPSRERKKKWWKRRNSRSTDPGRPLREILNNWSFNEIWALVQEYDTIATEKELYIQSESARPRPQTIRSDLADLLDFKWNSDVNLMLPPAIFPAHRAILMQRSKYFRSLLHPSNGGMTNVNVEDTVDIPTFSSLLRYLYTEESHTDLLQFADLFGGRPRGLESDLRDLLQTGKYSDVIVIFGDEQYQCHKCILAARSPFFRSLLQRRSNSKKIVLDENVIPKRYARVILQCMYTDRVDLNLIDPARSGLSEVESLTFTGRVNPAVYEEAMELYQIGRFLEFDLLCQTSEDVIVEQLSYESLPTILQWSSKSHGSNWVRRQAMMFVREEFMQLSSTNAFLELDKSTLMETLESDFLQASEADVLLAIIKWGEHQLMRRVEDREPNLLSNTRDSVARKGVKRRDLNDSELREIISDLIRLVRTDHILLNNDVLAIIRRGLMPIPPSHMLTEEKTNPWIHSSGLYVRPRLYTPFYEESKAAMRRCGNHPTLSAIALDASNSLGRKTLRSVIPDTLYMIDGETTTRKDSRLHPHRQSVVKLPQGLKSDDANVIVDPEIMTAMQYREKKLCSAHQRALNLPSRRIIRKYIRLRVVREFGLPDYVADLLDLNKYNQTYTEDATSNQGAAAVTESQVAGTSAELQQVISSLPDRQLADLHLSENMPDVALTTTASENARLEDVVDLDLGDGPRRTQSIGRHVFNQAAVNSLPLTLRGLRTQRRDRFPSTETSLVSDHQQPSSSYQKLSPQAL